MDNKIYLRELPAYQTISDAREKYLSKNCCYDLSLLPTRGLQNEMRDFILYRSEQVAITTLSGDRTEYGQLCRFLTDKAAQDPELSGVGAGRMVPDAPHMDDERRAPTGL